MQLMKASLEAPPGLEAFLEADEAQGFASGGLLSLRDLGSRRSFAASWPSPPAPACRRAGCR